MASKKQKVAEKPINVNSIINLLDNSPGQTFSPRQIAKHIGVRNKQIVTALPVVLDQLAQEGAIDNPAPAAFRSKHQSEYIEGIVDFVNPNFAFVASESLEEDVMVYADKLNTALHSDKVALLVYPGSQKKNGRPIGEVVKVIARGNNRYVGILQSAGHYAHVVPDSRRMHADIFVPGSEINAAKDGEKVVVEIVEYPERRDMNPVGKVVKILGNPGDNNTEMHAILEEFGLPYAFEPDLENHANSIELTIDEKELSRRRDFRQVTTFTIDPASAKDFDDALSFKPISDNLFEVGIHIADVSHYVRRNSRLDKEAQKRATSVYLVDRTIPMLPENLSNNLCSLRPNEDRLAFAAVFEIDLKGNVKKEWFGRTVIHSNKRFTYEQAQQIIEQPEGEFAEPLRILNTIAYALRHMRFKKGAMSFETPEVYFELDKNGKPLSVKTKERKDAHMLIEDFMLLANRKVAEFMYNYRKGAEHNPAVYRIHLPPDPEKVQNFGRFVRAMGFKFRPEADNPAFAFNRLQNELKDNPAAHMVNMLAVRTMSKAKYATAAEGHYGLAFEHYTHFTSPIRRYPDVMVHRLLQAYLSKRPPKDATELNADCNHSSEREVVATQAERASIKYKQVEFIELQENKIYEGVVSGISEYGIYVEISENKCEGMIRLTGLKDDFYAYEPDRFRLVGRQSGRIIKFGDPMKVLVTNTDLQKRTIDFELIEPNLSEPFGKGGNRGRSKGPRRGRRR